jgi:hypothetical protein
MWRREDGRQEVFDAMYIDELIIVWCGDKAVSYCQISLVHNSRQAGPLNGRLVWKIPLV